MKLYIAAKQPVELDVERLIRELKHRNHEIVYEWWDEPWEPVKPEAHWELTDRMVNAIMGADALVLIPPDTGGLGCFIETGIAMGLRKDVYVVRYTSTSRGDSLAHVHDRASSFFHNGDLCSVVTGEELLAALRPGA